MKHRIVSAIKQRWYSSVASKPPSLDVNYSQSDYVDFMKTEVFCYSPTYAKARVIVNGQKKLLDALNRSNVIIGMLHHGSWILIGGVIRHVLNLPYTVIASRRNFDVMSDIDRRYWENAHQFVAAYYGSHFFYSDQSPFRIIKWLNKRPAVLGVVLDVREYNQNYDESKIMFDNRQLFVQTGPAKLARMANVSIVPAGIHYNLSLKKHELEFYDAISPENILSDTVLTQSVFKSLESNYTQYEQQCFYDIKEVFSIPHVPSKM